MRVVKKYLNYYLGVFILFLSFFSIFKALFNSIFNTTLFEYFDEVILAISIMALLPEMIFRNRIKLVYFIIAIYIIYSILISLIFGFNTDFIAISFQTLMSIKFFVVLLLFLKFFKNNNRTLNRFFIAVIAFTIFGLILHLSLGLKFNDWMNIPDFWRPRKRYVSFFTHPNHLAYIMLLYAGYILNKRFTLNQNLSKLDVLKILVSVFIIILSDSRTAILAIGILFIAFYFNFLKSNIKIVFSFLIVGAAVTIYTMLFTNLFDSIIQNFNQSIDLTSNYIRGNMIYLSVLIILDYFPIGTGAASFGSVLSNDKVYEIYGQADRYYFKNEIGIYDSNIASILGEYGIIGIIIFSMIFYYSVAYLASSTKKRTLLVPLIFVFIFYMITNPMLTNNLYTIMTSITLVLFVSQKK